jgi:hypothetical protein
LVDGGTANDGQNGMPVLLGVGEALEQEKAHAFGKAGAVRLC